MIAGMFAFTACSDDNSPGNQPDGTPLNPTDVPAAVLNAFEKQYPDANNVQWTKKDNYAVATFTKSGDTSGQQSAWFAWDNGTWGMTEYEIPYSLLPDDVRTAFEASEYAASPWRYDREIDVLQRNETETLYVIEVEKNEAGTETEVDLYYTADGLLVKEIIDAERDKDYHEFLPQAPEGSISDWLKSPARSAGMMCRICCSMAFLQAGAAMSSRLAVTREITRSTLPSTAGTGTPKAIDAMAPAV